MDQWGVVHYSLLVLLLAVLVTSLVIMDRTATDTTRARSILFWGSIGLTLVTFLSIMVLVLEIALVDLSVTLGR